MTSQLSLNLGIFQTCNNNLSNSLLHSPLNSLWTGSLFGEKNSKEWEGKGRWERAYRQIFEAAILPSCNYLAEYLSVRSLSVNQFCMWVTPGKFYRKWAMFCSFSKQSKQTTSLIVNFAKNCWSSVRELIRCRSLAFQEIRPCRLTVAKTALY